MSRPKRTRRPSKAREAAAFAFAAALAFDLLLTGFHLWAPSAELRLQLFFILESWDALKGAFVVLGMLVVAFRARSYMLGAFGVVLGVIGLVEERTGWRLSLQVLAQLGADPDGVVAGRPLWVYGELLVLSVIALVATLAIWSTKPRSEDLAIVRGDLFVLLGVLFLFSVVVGFVAELWNWPELKVFEEIGERMAMSLILGYTVGLLMAPPATSDTTASN